MMKTPSILTATIIAAFASSVSAADMGATYVEPVHRDGVRIGVLTCDVGAGLGYVLGSAKSLDCVFSSTRGTVDHYTGFVRKMGIDLGYTSRSRVVWAVFAPTAGYHPGSLSGLYQGITAEATVGAGVGANILIGGTAGSIHLQTLSVSGQLGLNIAATGTSLTLTPQG